MKPNPAPSIADILVVVVAPVTAIAGTKKLTHSDGDLAAHIRMGETILGTGRIPEYSLASFTAGSDPHVAHAWLSEIILGSLFTAGGIALVAIATATLVALTHSSVTLFLRNRGADPRWALTAAFASLAVSSTHWLARPHMFSIAGAAITLYLLESRRNIRPVLFAVLYVLWANLHGGWLYGLVMIAAYAVGDFVEMRLAAADERREWRRRLRHDFTALAAASAATLINPFGVHLHREVIASATSGDLARRMGEFLPPDLFSAAPLPFFLAVIGVLVILGIGSRRMSFPHLAVVMLSLVLAFKSFRNIAFFGVTAWPLVALHATSTWPPRLRRFPYFESIGRLDRGTRVGLYAIPVLVFLAAIGLNGGRMFGREIVTRDFRPDVFPVAAVAKAREGRLDGRVFETWVWGGYIMYAWPGARLIVDPLEFNQATLDAYSAIDSAGQRSTDEIARWNIRTIIIRPSSPLAATLERHPQWKVWYRDSTAVIFRPQSDSTHASVDPI